MNFDDGQFDGGDGIAQRIGIMRERARVQHHDIGIGYVKRINERAFVVRLHRLNFNAERVTKGLQAFVDGVERGRSVNRRLARAEQIEVGAVQNQNFHRLYFRAKAWRHEVFLCLKTFVVY